MPVLTGLDVLIRDGFDRWNRERLGLVCHQASVARDLVHAIDHFRAGGANLQAVFGPQHGVWGYTQDNMIEWQTYRDERTGLPFYSLYGETREPTDAMLDGLDRLVFDVQDVGTRVYTFVWTLAYCLKASARAGIPVTVLDRPNPIGRQVEGPPLDPAFASFVGLHPCPLRHGRTLGEMALFLRDQHYPGAQVDVVPCEGWDGEHLGDLPWVPPSPNMPSVETAWVYPGMVLLEGTNISEGRGTTRPFETMGAPWLDPWRLADELNERHLPGCYWRPITFQPTFQKHAGELCGGVFLHVTDRAAFRPVWATINAFDVMWRQSEGQMAWNPPPYEYETLLMPIDILWGSDSLREAVECGKVESLHDLLGKTSQNGALLRAYF